MTDSTIAHASAQVIAARAKPAAIKAFFDDATNTVSYVVHDPATKRAAIIDSVLDYDPAAGRTSFASADKIIAFVKEHDLAIDWLLETHAHADHLSAAPHLQEKLGGQIAIGEHIVTVQNSFGKLFNAGSDFERDGSDFDHLWKDGDRFQIGQIEVTVLHVPGHTPADNAYVIGDAVFVGDTMFMPDYGSARVDFPGGNAAALYKSVRKILALPESTRIFCCHDYKAPGRDKFAWETTVAQQRRANLHVRDGVSEDEFVAMRTARDKTLNMPALLIPAIQLNIRAGALPPAEDNGVAYVKVPLNAI